VRRGVVRVADLVFGSLGESQGAQMKITRDVVLGMQGIPAQTDQPNRSEQRLPGLLEELYQCSASVQFDLAMGLYEGPKEEAARTLARALHDLRAAIQIFESIKGPQS
jgi:hypothetical protein